MNTGHAWKQQTDESAKAYRAFVLYRDGGHQRSYQRVAQALGVSPRLIARWGTRHGWVERARHWDNHLADITLDAVQQAQRASTVIEHLLDRLSDAAIAELTPSEIVTLTELGVVLTLASFQGPKSAQVTAWLNHRVELLL